LSDILNEQKDDANAGEWKVLLRKGRKSLRKRRIVEIKDAGLIAAAPRAEHCEMGGYGAARTYTELLGDKEGAKLLALTLEEKKQPIKSCHDWRSLQ
jgi:ferritin-like metal-binding protein YciE